MHSSTPVERPRFDIADIVRRHRAELEDETLVTMDQRRVLSAIALCRTAALGGHLDVCHSCGFSVPVYNSCRNRHCPKCQGLAQQKWIEGRRKRLLPVPHFHLVFTLPSELRRLAQTFPRALFGALFSTASETLVELASTHLKARLGVTMVLHTWARDLRFHPHVHALVTSGGLALDGSSWVKSDKNFLFHVNVMGALFRGKMMAQLRFLHAKGDFASFDDFADPEGFDRLMKALMRKNWIVYAKQPFGSVDHVLQYLGRYTHRVGISNSRFIDVTEKHVVFSTKEGKSVSLSPVEFLHRFVQHVLPSKFQKIRHYGLYAGASADNLALAYELISPPPPIESTPALSDNFADMLWELTGRDIKACPRCGAALVAEPLPLEPATDSVTGHAARAPPSVRPS